MKSPTLYLASASPRRKELLTRAGLKFQIVRPDIPEKMRPHEAPKAFAKRMAIEKATAAKNLISRSDCLILAADTIVVSMNGAITLGKPADLVDAQRMLRQIQGKRHKVYTSYAIFLYQAGKLVKKHTRTVCSTVQIRKLNSAEITRYLLCGESLDKAGAYAAQGYGAALIQEIKGSYTNVVGLPLCQVLTDLDRIFKVRFLGEKAR